MVNTILSSFVMIASISKIIVVSRLILFASLNFLLVNIFLVFLMNVFLFLMASIADHIVPYAAPVIINAIRNAIVFVCVLNSNPRNAPIAINSLLSPPPHCPV